MVEDYQEKVDTLILIDSPVPLGPDRLPQHFYEYCNKVHLFGQSRREKDPVEAPEWLPPYFNATIDTLHEYYACPLSLNSANKPRVPIMWACQSVMDITDIPRPPSCEQDTEGMKFLTEACTDFSDCGWGRLFRG